MRRWITSDDFVETFCKLLQRGHGFLLSKLSLSDSNRTKSAFDNSAFESANWWVIPEVRRRWNQKITGDSDTLYEDLVSDEFLKGGKLKMLSLGSGVCSHELRFAKTQRFEKIDCLDIAGNLLAIAKEKAAANDLDCMRFHEVDIKKFVFEQEEYDIVLFHSSLHHFSDIDILLKEKVAKSLKTKGLVVINEYVGPKRMQFSEEQIKSVNAALRQVPKWLRQRYKLPFHKNRVSGPGWWRMIIADPSECIESDEILHTMNKYFKCLYHRDFGGNILMPVLKDIAHHFVISDKEKSEILEKLFRLEDEFLETHDSDFVFAIYQKC